MRHNDFLHQGDRGEFMEEDMTGANRYEVKVDREDGSQPPIRWQLQLPQLALTQKRDADDRAKFKEGFKHMREALRECIQSFMVPREAGWTDKEYAMVKKKVASLLWDPPSEWAQRMHLEIAEAIGTENFADLEMYPTSKTAADQYHGIDEILIYKTPAGQKLLLTLDLSARQKETFKADILVTETGAQLNPEFYRITKDSAFDIPDIEKATAAEQGVTDQRRREKLAALIAFALAQKEKNLKDSARSDGRFEFYPIEQSLLGESPDTRARKGLQHMRHHNRRRLGQTLEPKRQEG